MKLTFILPTVGVCHSGGAKVIYEYANGMAKRGHAVTVVHTLPHSSVEKGFLFRYAVYFGRWVGLRGGYGPRGWMHVDSRVRIRWVPTLNSRYIPSADTVVATAWHTAVAVRDYPADKGRKYYFVQDYEHFMVAPPGIRECMQATYVGPFRNIAISPACAEIVEASGGRIYCQIPNGLDHAVYRLIEPINSPRRRLIGFPTRSEPFKRTQDAVEALRLFREKSNCDFGFWSFGAKRPEGLPDWIEFHERPTDEELVHLYNQTAIFVVPSEYEGWGLPGSEAMCCGAALVSTDNGGVLAYAEHARTALLSEPKNTEALASNLLMLASDPYLRKTIAATGHEQIRQFTWERSVDALESILGEQS